METIISYMNSLTPKTPKNMYCTALLAKPLKYDFSWKPMAAILDFVLSQILPALLQGAWGPNLLFTLQIRQNHWETKFHSPRSRNPHKWPNYNSNTVHQHIWEKNYFKGKQIWVTQIELLFHLMKPFLRNLQENI